jgi:hypothetical protein
MGRIKEAVPAKLIVGFIYNDSIDAEGVARLLCRRFGNVEQQSRAIAFTHTTYYESEMGPRLKRRFVSYEKLIDIEKVWRIKKFTNEVETRYATAGKRNINIDPGYIVLGKLVLLTTKDYTHRLYLGGGIYAEATLFFKEGTFRAQNFTYPDYRLQEHIDFFTSVRNCYKRQLESGAHI